MILNPETQICANCLWFKALCYTARELALGFRIHAIIYFSRESFMSSLTTPRNNENVRSSAFRPVKLADLDRPPEGGTPNDVLRRRALEQVTR